MTRRGIRKKKLEIVHCGAIRHASASSPEGLGRFGIDYVTPVGWVGPSMFSWLHTQEAQMDPAQRIVTQMPLSDLWKDAGLINAHRHGRVGRDDISKLLRDGSTFVVADLGHPLRWIPEQDRSTFWKAEVQDHLVPADVGEAPLRLRRRDRNTLRDLRGSFSPGRALQRLRT